MRAPHGVERARVFFAAELPFTKILESVLKNDDACVRIAEGEQRWQWRYESGSQLGNPPSDLQSPLDCQ